MRFVEERFGIAEHYEIIARELEAYPAGLVIPDTLQAFFLGRRQQQQRSDEARRGDLSRGDGARPGGALSGASGEGRVWDRNIPYGGGALLNEVDGNLSLWGPPDRVELSWCGKFRGSFEPMHFAIDIGAVPDETDSDGDPIKAVAARLLDESNWRPAEVRRLNAEQRSCLRRSRQTPAPACRDLADACSQLRHRMEQEQRRPTAAGARNSAPGRGHSWPLDAHGHREAGL